MNLMQMYQQLRNNPMQILAKRFNLPQNMSMANPNSIIEYLMNTGQVSQQQINSLMGMQNNPIIQQIMQGKF